MGNKKRGRYGKQADPKHPPATRSVSKAKPSGATDEVGAAKTVSYAGGADIPTRIYHPHGRILVLWRCLWTASAAALGLLLTRLSLHPAFFLLLGGLWAGGLLYLRLLHNAYGLALHQNTIRLSGGVVFRKVQCFPLSALQGVSCHGDPLLWALGLRGLVLKAAGARFPFPGLTADDAAEIAAFLTASPCSTKPAADSVGKE